MTYDLDALLRQEEHSADTATAKSRKRRSRKAAKAAKRGNKKPPPAAPKAPTFKAPPLEPRNQAQADLIEALCTDEQVICVGPAGTGKTFLPAALAADWLQAGDISRIVVTRPAVCADEDHGFLPGGIDSKFEPYIAPVLDALAARLGAAKLAQLRKDGVIDFIPLAYMRGRTFDDTFVLLDEAQNTTPAQMKMFLTRIGDNSIVVINGDPAQSDLDPDMGNGLSLVMHVAATQELPVQIVTFRTQDIVRSRICALWAGAFASEESHAAATDDDQETRSLTCIRRV